MSKDKKNGLRHLPARILAVSYLLVIMTTSVVFSSVFFIISLNELSKQFSDDGSLELGTTLIILNIVTLAIGIALSYWFTQRVLRPIEKMLEKQDQYIADASHGIRTP